MRAHTFAAGRGSFTAVQFADGKRTAYTKIALALLVRVADIFASAKHVDIVRQTLILKRAPLHSHRHLRACLLTPKVLAFGTTRRPCAPHRGLPCWQVCAHVKPKAGAVDELTAASHFLVASLHQLQGS